MGGEEIALRLKGGRWGWWGKWRRIRRRIPAAVLTVLHHLQSSGYQAYLVGGAPRDLLLGRVPQDWDITTDARPEQVKAVFPRTFPLGEKFGTVGVLLDDTQVEVTTFRQEGGYSDGRRPDWVAFTPAVGDDLARRDFTINAIALDPLGEKLVDPYGGVKDLKQRLVRAVGDPRVRFGEDPLRMLRFYRFQATLGFRGETGTEQGITAGLIGKVSGERLRDELTKILTAAAPALGLEGLARSGLLTVILPEFGPVWPADPALFRHLVATVEAIKPCPELRWAAFLHDLGKVTTRRVAADGRIHYYGHDRVSQELAAAILERLHFPNTSRQKILTLIRWHMFAADPALTDAALRRLVGKVGPEHIFDLLELRRADIVATGSPSYRARESLAFLARRIEALLAGETVLTRKDLAVDGHEVMAFLALPPGPEVGAVLNEIFRWVTEDPARNRKDRILAFLAERYRGH
ncbi:MAG: HD domain-containing protein [Firmicutes bacterium]|nr:HD domain-containing protein [Bacillota bacterium]